MYYLATKPKPFSSNKNATNFFGHNEESTHP
jgi:hypothetical protein